jgi:rhodanese-related sulfurtransferase
VGLVFSTHLPTLSPAEVAAAAAEGWMLLDVRTDQEWAAGHIAGAVHIPMVELGDRLDEIGNRVICVCAVGSRSARVTQWLLRQGREAVNLDGGIWAWAQDGLPVETDG